MACMLLAQRGAPSFHLVYASETSSISKVTPRNHSCSLRIREASSCETTTILTVTAVPGYAGKINLAVAKAHSTSLTTIENVQYDTQPSGHHSKSTVDATLATETLLQSEMAGIADAAAEAVALAKAAVKAARDVVALSEDQAISTSEYLKDFASEADLLRLERARLTEMERLGVMQSLHKIKAENYQQEDCEPQFSIAPSSPYELKIDGNLFAKNVADSSRHPIQQTYNVRVRSRRQMERSLKRSRALDKAANVAARPVQKGKKSVASMTNSSDPLTLLLNSTSSRLLTAEEEVLLSKGIQDLMKLDKIRESCKKTMGKEPTMAQWAQAVGVDQNTLKRRLEVGRRSKNKMIRSNLRLVASVARKYENRGMSLRDLIQVGSTGLIQGAEKFDSSRGFKFSTYAHWWIMQAMTKAIPEHTSANRLPMHIFMLLSRIRKATSLLNEEHEREPTTEEVAEVAGLSVKRMRKVIRYSRFPKSFDRMVGPEKETKLSEIIEDPDSESLEEIACDQLMKEDLHIALKTLTAQECQVIRLRYGMDDGRWRTLKEIGKIIHLSRERTRQIVLNATRKLKQNYRSKHLRHHLHI